MGFPPTAYLIGTQKGGTTFLASLLGQHPDVCLSEPKEPNYFTQHYHKGEDWYKSRFPDSDKKILLDASTSYSASPINSDQDNQSPMKGVPEKIHKLSPDARFIYLLRNPVKRAHSSYWHHVRGGGEKRSFQQAMMETTYYLRMGQYWDQLELYFQYFDRDKFKILLFEEFIKNPQAHANQCLEFLGLDSLSSFDTKSGKNESFIYKPSLNKVNRMLSNYGGLNAIVKAVKSYVPRELVNMVFGQVTEKVPGITAEEESFLKGFYENENKKLSQNIGIDLSIWQ